MQIVNYILEKTEKSKMVQLFHDGVSYHMENSPANQWNGFYMIEAYITKESTLSCIMLKNGHCPLTSDCF